MSTKRKRIDVMIDAHVWMRRQARMYGEWPDGLGRTSPIASPEAATIERPRAPRDTARTGPLAFGQISISGKR
jgi:hypothetical protein